MKQKDCPYCGENKKVEEVIIKLIGGQEQKVYLCMKCQRIFSMK